MSTEKVQQLASSIHELSKTYQPPDATSMNLTESEIITKAKELITVAADPRDHAMSLLLALVEAATIKTLQSFGAFQAIPESGSITLQDLEAKTGAEAALLERLLRVLVGSKMVLSSTDDKHNITYAHTPLSYAYTTETLGAFFSILFNELATTWKLPDYFAARGAKEPEGEEASTHNPQSWALGQEGKTAFEIVNQDPQKLKDMQLLMVMAEQIRPYTGFYDFGKLATGVDGDAETLALVDMGGADGTTVSRILGAHPDLKPEQCVVQDLPASVERAKKNPILPKGVRCEGHDFFTPQQTKNARAYMLRAVCHDWSDGAVIKILKNIVPAMAKDSKVLIGDAVLPETGVSGLAACMDMMMLNIGGKERTRRNWDDVLGAAGLKIDDVFYAQGNFGFAMLETSLR